MPKPVETDRSLLGRAPLQRPFVSTVATVIAVTAAACGDAASKDVAADQDAGANPAACPKAAPLDRSSCTAADSICGYDYCGTTPATNAYCVQGTWNVVVSPCPSAADAETPDAASSEATSDAHAATCPATKPVDGAVCDVLPTSPCSYGDCYGMPATTASCTGGKWSVSTPPCNPPSPE